MLHYEIYRPLNYSSPLWYLQLLDDSPPGQFSLPSPTFLQFQLNDADSAGGGEGKLAGGQMHIILPGFYQAAQHRHDADEHDGDVSRVYCWSGSAAATAVHLVTSQHAVFHHSFDGCALITQS